MALKRTVAMMAPLAFLAAGLVAAASARTSQRPVSVVLVSIDGLRPDSVLEADRLGLHVPNLRRFLVEGAFATGVQGVVPTVTFPSHTTQVTGVSPARHGIVANSPFDPQGRNLDAWFWYAEDIKVKTLWDAAAEAGMVTSSVDWPATAGARITYNIPQYWRARSPDDRKLQRLLVTPGLLPETERALGQYPLSHQWTVEYDARRAAFNAFVIEKKQPRLHFAYLSGLDEEEHASGPSSESAKAVLERIDSLVGQIRAAAEKGGNAVVAVVSDHGFERTDKELHLNAALRAAGLITVGAGGRVVSWRATAWTTGGSAAVMLNDPRDEEARQTTRRVLQRLSSDPRYGIRQVLEGQALRAAGGFPEAAFVVGLREGYRMGSEDEGPVVRSAEAYGTHGMLPDDHSMDASFFIAGPGIPPGRSLGRIDMRDIAPTLAARLGLSLPEAEGRNVLD
jgi:predicted AlkP superfamily pyrophosphatase or phosphodiesterase